MIEEPSVCESAVLAGGEHDGGAERLEVGLVDPGEVLVEFVLALATHAVLGAGLDAEATVAGAIEEDGGFHGELVLGRGARCGDGLDAVAVHDDAVDGGVEEQGDVGLGDDLVVEQLVPHVRRALGVPDGVFQTQLLDDARLAGVRDLAVAVGADDVHADFGGGVAAEDVAVLDEDDLGAVAGGGEGGG